MQHWKLYTYRLSTDSVFCNNSRMQIIFINNSWYLQYSKYSHPRIYLHRYSHLHSHPLISILWYFHVHPLPHIFMHRYSHMHPHPRISKFWHPIHLYSRCLIIHVSIIYVYINPSPEKSCFRSLHGKLLPQFSTYMHRTGFIVKRKQVRITNYLGIPINW